MKEKKNLVLFITVLLFLGMFIGNYGNYQLSAVPGSVYQAYNLTDIQFSSIMTAPMFPSIFLSIIIGILVDRFGISKMVSITADCLLDFSRCKPYHRAFMAGCCP